jgi:hypothetical protein
MWRGIVLGLLLVFASIAVAHAMDTDDVIGMIGAGIGEDVILKAVDASGDQLVITPDDLVTLKDAGASDWFLDEILDRGRTSHSSGLSDTYGGRYGYGDNYGDSYYDLYRPTRTYITLGLVYDPFDYYFAGYPYYYAYVAPFSFTWNWWYWGGPYHRTWCAPFGGDRIHHYYANWGTRTIWDRGYRPVRNHVPSYGPFGKGLDRADLGRPVQYRPGSPGNVRRNDSGVAWGRRTPDDKSVRTNTRRENGRPENSRQVREEPVRSSPAPARHERDQRPETRPNDRPSRNDPPPVRQNEPTPAAPRDKAPTPPRRNVWTR